MKFTSLLCHTILLFVHTCFAGKTQQQSKNNETVVEINHKCIKSEYIIKTSGELAAISSCSILFGSVCIENFNSDTLYLGQIQEIHGDLIVKNSSQIIKMEAPDLSFVEGKLELNTLNSLTYISFPKLETVDALQWEVLPILTFVDLEAGIKNINSVTMADTSLSGFGGFNTETLRTLNINNNRFLEKIESTVSKITGDLLIAANADNVHVSLPNLTTVTTLTIKDTESINMENLQVVGKSADFSHNSFQKLDLSHLRSLGDTLSIIKNKNLNEVKLEKLTEVSGGLIIIDNHDLNNLDFFISLKSVGGATEFQGDIQSNHFSKLKVIKGSAILKSSNKGFDCADWMKNEVGKVVRGGKVECGSGKSNTTEILLVDEDGKSVQGGTVINDNKETGSRSGFTKQKSGATTSKLSRKMATLISIYIIGFLIQLI